MKLKVKIGVSNHHVHLKKETYEALFDEPIKKKKDLNQIGQFASEQTLTIKNDKCEIPNVRVLGPFRNYDQVEISKSDARKLGIDPPVRDSGDLKDALEITLVTEKSSVVVKGCILAKRHIHMNTTEALKLGIKNLQPMRLIIDNEKSGTLNGVVKVSDDGYFEAHIDTDEAAAFNLNNNDEVEVEI